MIKELSILVATLCIAFSGWGQDEKADTIVAPAKTNIIDKIKAYLDDSNKPKQNKAFDFSIIGGPHYSSDKGFGVGFVAAGTYRLNPADSLIQPSNTSIFFNGTTGLFFNVGIEGLMIFPGDRHRLTYSCTFQAYDTYFWGIGYDMDRNNANKSQYKYLKVELPVDFTWRVGSHIYMGPMATFDYVNAYHRDNPELWENESARTFNLGLGYAFRYDSRDFAPCPYHGLYIAFEQKFYPKFLANKYAFSMTELRAQFYHPAWKDATIAYQVHGRFTYGNVPWGLLSTFGGSQSMRGYYEGRYVDKCDITACLEVRQHIWHRNGLVAWIGAGSVFPDFEHLQMRRVLPNGGIGYRWEFKKRMNVRLDYGIGKHCSGIVFSINEAF
ncbi:MAG: BamA/TamA family outer membrane protein [Bacteroidales bacterium]|nr:BamA/TamA family outer membrane protein [Bacteroidales bacterium]